MIWSVKPLKELCRIEKGTIGITKAIPGPYPLLTLAEERKAHSEYQFDTKAVIIPLVSSTGHGHASIKRIHYQEGKFAVGTILCAVIPKNESGLHPLFLYHYLDVFKELLIVPLMRGMANVTLPIGSLGELEIPVPPIADQLVWVEKFESTSEKQTKLLNELTHQQTLLKQLRQAILQEAIQGKLTEAWRAAHPEVEPASALLKRIQAEKARLVKEKKIKKPKPLPPITEDEVPFDLPEGWVWCRLGDVSNFIDYRGKTPKKVDKGVKLITAKNVKVGYFSSEPEEFITKSDYQKHMTRGIPVDGDILFTTEAPMGNACLLKQIDVFALAQRIITIQTIDFSSEFLLLVILSSAFKEQLIKKASGVTARGIKSSRLVEILIPLPPLAEQQAIVEQVESLLAKVSQLEQEVEQNRQYAEQLLQSVLREVMQGTERTRLA